MKKGTGTRRRRSGWRRQCSRLEGFRNGRRFAHLISCVISEKPRRSLKPFCTGPAAGPAVASRVKPTGP